MATRFRLHKEMAERDLLEVKKLSELSGVHRNVISRIYHNRTKRVDLVTLDRLASALGCTPVELIEYTRD